MIQKLKTFKYVFVNSLYKPLYYKHVLKSSIWFSLKYLFFLSFLIFFIQILTLVVFIIPKIGSLPELVDNAYTRVFDFYPSELEVTIDEGILSTNQKNPYYIEIPEMSEDEDFDHFITVDTNANIEDYSVYKTTILVTDSSFIYPDNQSSYAVTSVSDLEWSGVFTSKDYQKIVKELEPAFEAVSKYAPVVLLALFVLVPPIVSIFIVLGHLIFLLFMSLILWFVSIIMKVELSYQQIYHLGIHSLTVPIIITSVLGIFGIHMEMLFTSSFLLFMVYILLKLDLVVKKK